MSSPTPSDSPEQIQKEMEAMGRRLALLLASCDLPQEMKEAWAMLVPEMNPEQIDRFVRILEQHVPSGTEVEFEAFKKSLMEIEKNHEDSIQTAADEAIAAFEKMENQL